MSSCPPLLQKTFNFGYRVYCLILVGWSNTGVLASMISVVCSRGVTIYRYVSVSGYKGHDTIYRFRLLNADIYLTLIKILANLQFVSFHETPGWLSDNRHVSH